MVSFVDKVWGVLKLYSNSENQKTDEKEDDIKAILKIIWCCYKASISFTNIIKSLIK